MLLQNKYKRALDFTIYVIDFLDFRQLYPVCNKYLLLHRKLVIQCWEWVVRGTLIIFLSFNSKAITP